jgi:hypothetical protein
LVAQTKIQNDRGPVIKITVAIGDEKEVEASWSPWFQPNPMQAMSFLPSGPQLPKAYEGVEEASSGAETCCFFLDPMMKTYKVVARHLAGAEDASRASSESIATTTRWPAASIGNRWRTTAALSAPACPRASSRRIGI